MVDRDEGNQIATTGNMVTQDWDAAWDSEEDAPRHGDSDRASLEEARKASEISFPKASPLVDDDEAAEAWGWGDEDAEEAVDDPMSNDVVEPPPSSHTTAPHRIALETREITLSESYQTTSMPQPVFQTIAGIYNDGARLTSPACVLRCPYLNLTDNL